MSTEPAPPARLSPADYDAIVAAQEHLMRQGSALLAAAAIPQQARTMNALTARLDAIGAKLILDADRQDRRVHVTSEPFIPLTGLPPFLAMKRQPTHRSI